MDETMCQFDMPLRYTNEFRGTKQVRIETTGNTKRGYTVVLCCNATGVKLPALIVFKEPRGVLNDRIRNRLQVHGNVDICATASGWLILDMFHWWLRNIFIFDEEGFFTRRLLILDEYTAHKTEESKRIINEE